ncbi:MAG: hypothetical protein ABI574_13270 [Burkholderiales bacterium]
MKTLSTKALLAMAHSPVRNYVIPGLTSYLIGSPGPAGTVRLFVNERDHQEAIAPHSHRFSFQCQVLRGAVRNRVWTQCSAGCGDFYTVSELRYRGNVGSYEKVAIESGRYMHRDEIHDEGAVYSMRPEEIHSIFFSRGAMVLFFEGPTVADRSILLEPLIDGETVPTGAVLPWMFQRGIRPTTAT